MPEQSDVYEASGELNNLLADRHGLAEDAKRDTGLSPGQPGMPYDAADLPEEIDGVKVERPVKTEPTLRGFFRSEISDPAFYAEHRAEILEARNRNLIVDDLSNPAWVAQQKARRDEAQYSLNKGNERIALPILVREATKAADAAYKAFKAAEVEHMDWMKTHGIMGDPRVSQAAARVVWDKKAEWETATEKLKGLEAQNRDMRLGRVPQEAQ